MLDEMRIWLRPKSGAPIGAKWVVLTWWSQGRRMEETNPDLSPIGIVGLSTMHSLNSTNKQPEAWPEPSKPGALTQQIKVHVFPGSQYLHVSKYKCPFFKTMGIKLSNSVG